MDLNGTWKQAGGFVFDTSGIIIKGNELLRRKRIEGREPEWKSDRFSLTEGISMDGCPSWNLKIEGDTYNQMDYMIHEEEIGGKTVTVLSAMGMEYDGRGRIVLATLLREEDHSLVGKDFVSRACKFYNQRPAPSMRMASPPSMDFMMHWPNMGAAPQSPSEVKTEEFWSCSCGNEKNIGRFCTECGSPKPKL